MDVFQFALEGKVALVTGANRGIGAATAIGFAKAGADVAIASRNTPGRGLGDLEDVAKEVRAQGRKALSVPVDIGEMNQLRALVDKVVAEFGTIDILVNNAGTSDLTPVLEVEERQWDAIMNVNLKGLFFLSQAAAKVMKEHCGGIIINTASVNAYKPNLDTGVYAISKAGVVMATRILAGGLAKYKIRVNCVAPGAIETFLFNSKWDGLSEERKNQDKETIYIPRIPLGRIGDPSEIANTMIWLASDASSYVTGQTFIVDGGALI